MRAREQDPQSGAAIEAALMGAMSSYLDRLVIKLETSVNEAERVATTSGATPEYVTGLGDGMASAIRTLNASRTELERLVLG